MCVIRHVYSFSTRKTFKEAANSLFDMKLAQMVYCSVQGQSCHVILRPAMHFIHKVEKKKSKGKGRADAASGCV